MVRMRSVWLAGLAAMAVLALTSGLQSQDTKGQQAKLKLLVPANAVVEIEGVTTKSTGAERHFVSPPLAPGKNYSYSVKVTWKDAAGNEQKSEKVVKVQPGQESVLDLRAEATAKPAPEDKKPDDTKKEDKKKPDDTKKEDKKPDDTKKEDKKPDDTKKEDKKPDDKKGAAEEVDKTPDVIFVPTPNDVVKKMLQMAKVGKDDVVYDLGCGDGRIVVTAVKDFHAKKGIGYDIDPQRIKESLENVAKNKVGDKVKIEKKDIFTLDLSGANVITLYLLPTLNVRLIPQLEKLKAGSRIVSHDFDMVGVTPDDVKEVEATDDNGNKRTHKVYLWTVPLKKEKKE